MEDAENSEEENLEYPQERPSYNRDERSETTTQFWVAAVAACLSFLLYAYVGRRRREAKQRAVRYRPHDTRKRGGCFPDIATPSEQKGIFILTSFRGEEKEKGTTYRSSETGLSSYKSTSLREALLDQ